MRYPLNLSTVVGLVHVSGMIAENAYGFLIGADPWLDTLYMLSFLGIPLSWMLLKDECLISYLVKRYNDPTYRLGSAPESIDDIEALFPNPIAYGLFYHANYLSRLGSVFIVNHRTSQIPLGLLGPTCLLYVLYIYDVTYRLDYRHRLFPYVQGLFLILLVASGGYNNFKTLL